MKQNKISELDKYTLLDEFSSGGFGTIYKAHDPALDRHVALKVLLPHLTKEPSRWSVSA